VGEKEALTFEDAFQALEEAVQELEGGELELNEAIALYEKGMRLARRCGEALDAAELRVRELEIAEKPQQVELWND
jgi:exodeoxyribonuclease VII small subunit